MNIVKYIILLVVLSYRSFACQCPLTVLNEAETNKYDIVFKGKITSVKLSKERSEALFAIQELYKGPIGETFTVLFNDADVCKLELTAGDEWIIYANFKQISNAQLDFCSRSRKFFKNAKEDFFAVTTGISYDEEMKYLQTKLGLHTCLKNNPNMSENRNIIPSSGQFIIFIVCSIIGVIVFYWLVNNFFK
jgi:hypothetical protein